GLLQALGAAARREGCALYALTDDEMRQAAARVVARGIRRQCADPRVRAEVQGCLRPDRDPRRDGIPDAAQGEWDRRSYLEPDPKAVEARGRRMAAEAPALIVLTTRADEPLAWLQAGQALARVLLLAAARGLAASYLNSAVEVAETRAQLERLLDDGRPQILFRLGYPTLPAADTPRRPAQEVLTLG
ncbi:MAG: nitroreductase family protein, partial [Rhodothermales bacterium]|nr:nitroreductase family protein [Rhodothermales bacterium]